MKELIGEAMLLGLQGLVVAGVVLFARSLYCDVARLCWRKDGR